MEISAGAIVYTIIDNNINYLLIEDFHNNWGFPKGHLENGETLIEAASREILEEVSLDVCINENFKEELIYTMPNGIEKHSIYFVANYQKQNPKKQLEEVKQIKLLPYQEAMCKLTFDNMKQVLTKANTYIKNHLQ